MKVIAIVALFCLWCIHMTAALGGFCDQEELELTMSCAGAMDNLYSRVSELQRWCSSDPKSQMCSVAKNNCRVAKAECDRICSAEGRRCPQQCPSGLQLWYRR